MTAKLPRYLFLRYWDIHAWLGVLGGVVLYVMFLAGAITLFYEPLATWAEPFAQRGSTQSLQSTLDQAFPEPITFPEELWIYLPKGGRMGTLFGHSTPDGPWKSLWVDPDSGTLVPERERLAPFLYSLHFLYHDVTGDWVYRTSGFLALGLLLALVTGVLIHLKDIVAQFHQFRPHKTRRVLWSDMHKVLGVMGLPFQTMYAYTGAYIVLLPYALGAFTGPAFGGDAARAEEAAWGFHWPDPAADAAEGVRPMPLDALIERARAAEPELRIDRVSVHRLGRSDGFADVRG